MQSEWLQAAGGYWASALGGRRTEGARQRGRPTASKLAREKASRTRETKLSSSRPAPRRTERRGAVAGELEAQKLEGGQGGRATMGSEERSWVGEGEGVESGKRKKVDFLFAPEGGRRKITACP
ncbi:hypothetical protein A7C99_1984 [Trichophyton rubrum]|uniref:Uncharacterized protein n=1 Tax=Trichophyton rubrum TaxID=5551 RepID=A0A178F3J5_TRIRU|nr:hypothetical protein A7C99_1984 [Trichophyton rubrum]